MKIGYSITLGEITLVKSDVFIKKDNMLYKEILKSTLDIHA
jgi:hypothetical protein